MGFQWHPLLPALYLFYTVAGSLPLKRRHSYLKWKKERLQRAVNLSKKDLQLSKIYTVGPHFKHCWLWSCVLLSDIMQSYIFSNIVFSNFIERKCFTLAGPWCIWVIMKVATYITYVYYDIYATIYWHNIIMYPCIPSCMHLLLLQCLYITRAIVIQRCQDQSSIIALYNNTSQDQ